MPSRRLRKGGYTKVDVVGSSPVTQDGDDDTLSSSSMRLSTQPAGASSSLASHDTALGLNGSQFADQQKRKSVRRSENGVPTPLASSNDVAAFGRRCCCGNGASITAMPLGARVTIVSIVGFVVIVSAPFLDFKVRACIATTALMATWWIVRYIPIGITSFLPVVIFPMCGISAANDIASAYYSDTVLLLVGTCIIALALERTNALTRLSFRVLAAMPARPRIVLLVFMVITAGLSIFVSNTAAAAVVCPILCQLRNALQAHSDSEERGLDRRIDTDDERRMRLIEKHLSDLQATIAECSPEVQKSLETLKGDAHLASLYAHGVSKGESIHSLARDATSAQTTTMEVYFSRAGMGVAFAAAMGGMASLTGTGPNVVLASVVSQSSSSESLDWGTFFVFGLPVASMMIACMWAGLSFVRFPQHVSIDLRVIRSRLKQLGQVDQAEATTLGLLLLLVLLWLLRAPGWLPESVGWAQLAFEPTYVSDATAAMFVSVLLFILPDPRGSASSTTTSGDASRGSGTAKPSSTFVERGPKILDWPYFVTKFPHSLVLLIAGGCALSEGFSASGLSSTLVDGVASLQGAVPPLALMLVLMLAAAALSQFTSNGATASILIPLASTLAEAEGIDGRVFMIPTALACSLAFMLPISTPPNAFAFELGLTSQATMLRWGLAFILVGLVVIPVGVVAFGGPLLGISFTPTNATSSVEGVSDDIRRVLPGESTTTEPILLADELWMEETTTTLNIVQPHLKDPYYYYSIGASSPSDMQVWRIPLWCACWVFRLRSCH